jgi:hypothetical protein
MAQPPVFIDKWQWVLDFHNAMIRKGDRLRTRLHPCYLESIKYMESNPDRAISHLLEGRSLAETLHEPLWALFFDHERAKVLIARKRDLNAGLELAVQVAVSANNAENRRWPFNPSVQYNLLSAYCFYDPLSYRDDILEGIGYLENELNFDREVWQLVPSVRHELNCIAEDAEAALKDVYQYLERGQGNNYILGFAHFRLCNHLFISGRYTDLMEAATMGVQRSRNRSLQKYTLIKLQLWQAIAAFALHDVALSQQHYRTALNTMHSLGDAFRRDLIENLPIYFEVTQELERALSCYDESVAQAAVSGSPFRAYASRLARCRLLKIMGLLTEAKIETTRDARNQLKHPDRYAPRLEKIIAGDTAHYLYNLAF